MFGMIGRNPKLKKRSSSAAPSAPRLPAVDIYSDKTGPLISGLSDLNFTGCSGSLLTSTRDNPILGNNVTFYDSMFQPTDFSNWSIWIWCNVLTIAGNLDTSGANGMAAFADYCCGTPIVGFGGTGGDGGSGGGGGGVSNSFSAPGGDGGSGGVGGAGSLGTLGCCGFYAGAGGSGSGATYMTGCPYLVPVGGNGGGVGGASFADPGVAGFGFGGGGAGGFAEPVSVINAGGGAGAAGGGIFIVANEIIGPGSLTSNGGMGGASVGLGGQPGFGGGGGSIYMAAKKYAASLSFSVTGAGICGCTTPAMNGNYRLGEINTAGTAVTTYHNNVNASWDNS